MEKSMDFLGLEKLEDLNYVFELSEEALAALDKQSPMTKEIFSECMDYCSKNKSDNLLYRLLEEYPEFALQYAENLEKEM